MLKVNPIQTKEEQKDLCNKFGIEFKPDCMAYSAYVDEELTGLCQFLLKGSDGFIIDLLNLPDKNDEEALFVMGRAALNFIDLIGIHKAYYTGSVDDSNEALIKKIGFRNIDGKWFMDLTGFFEAPCQHDHND